LFLSLHIRVVWIAGLLLAANAACADETWPTRPINLTVPFGPGSGSDLVARIIGSRASELLGQQIVIENMGGAGGVIGVAKVARAAPDGYQLVIGAVDTFAQSQTLFKRPAYNSLTDFTPVGLVTDQPLLLTVRKDLPVSNVKEFIAYVKANQAKMQFGSAGVGAAPHLLCLQVTTAIGAEVTHVPYRGSAEALKDLVAGSLDYYCPLAIGAIPLINAGSIKPLAILTEKRSPLLPNLPTAKEQGLDVADGDYWNGLFFPKGTPDAIIAKLNAVMNTTLDTPAVQARLRELATTATAPDQRSPDYLQHFVESEIAKWAAIMKAGGIEQQ
jgi:tripartite-type tricarboxylate transporter receptor subunit TctC